MILRRGIANNSSQDCFNVKGVCSTIGFTSFIKNGPVESNSAAVEIIVRLGGIPYVKTNIPQTMMVS
jgi:Asp-tRNA(Asn)/Glu-tRNA(Gln) amidotransferase A subunit family amidase